MRSRRPWPLRLRPLRIWHHGAWWQLRRRDELGPLVLPMFWRPLPGCIGDLVDRIDARIPWVWVSFTAF